MRKFNGKDALFQWNRYRFIRNVEKIKKICQRVQYIKGGKLWSVPTSFGSSAVGSQAVPIEWSREGWKVVVGAGTVLLGKQLLCHLAAAWAQDPSISFWHRSWGLKSHFPWYSKKVNILEERVDCGPRAATLEEFDEAEHCHKWSKLFFPHREAATTPQGNRRTSPSSCRLWEA